MLKNNILLVVCYYVFGTGVLLANNSEIDSLSLYEYEHAFNEISDMLDGKKELSFKRAVFLSENAYHKGTLDYFKYNEQITNIANLLQEFVKQKGLEKYKSAGNYAIYSYMKEESPLNENQVCMYDFEDFMGEKSYTSMFVTKLMRTKKGNCHSLPYYYKILANEIGAEACLAFGPNHVYIKHKDEGGKWVNVELTSGGFPSDAWIIRSMDISVEAIKSGIYMEPITEKQAVAQCLFDLAQGYIDQYGYNDFALKCSYKQIEYHHQNISAWLTIANSLGMAGIEMHKQDKTNSPELADLHEQYSEAQNKIVQLGYSDMSKEAYDEWVKSMDEEKTKQSQLNKN